MIESTHGRRRWAALGTNPLGPTVLGATVLGAAVAGGLTACGGASDPGTEGAPDSHALGALPPVILIVLDALGAEHITHLGYERATTPNLDAIAAEGVSFANCIVPAPYTVASVPSLLTGRLPDSHGVISSGFRLRPDEITLAEYFSGQGFRTVSVCSQPNAGPSTGNADGFDEFLQLWVPQEGQTPDVVIRGLEFMVPSARDVVDAAEPYLDQLADGDCFLYMHILEPHTPYQAPAGYIDRWTDPNYAGDFTPEDADDLLLKVYSGVPEISAADRAQTTDLYDGNLLWADHNVGLFVEQLKRRGIWDEALVIVTSDHGEAQWQHGTWGHNWELYDEYVRVPLVVKLPGDGGLRNRIVDTMVSTVDVLPTVLELADIPEESPYGVDGVSFAPLLYESEPTADARELLLRSSHIRPDFGTRSDLAKTILRQNPRPLVEHYDLAADPRERTDRFSADNEALKARVGALRRRFTELLQTPGMRADQMDARERAMLEELGYVEEL